MGGKRTRTGGGGAGMSAGDGALLVAARGRTKMQNPPATKRPSVVSECDASHLLDYDPHDLTLKRRHGLRTLKIHSSTTRPSHAHHTSHQPSPPHSARLSDLSPTTSSPHISGETPHQSRSSA